MTDSYWEEKKPYRLTNGDSLWGFEAGSTVWASVGTYACFVHDREKFPDAGKHSQGYWCIYKAEWEAMEPQPVAYPEEPKTLAERIDSFAEFKRAGDWRYRDSVRCVRPLIG
jgi:hypothetical protein